MAAGPGALFTLLLVAAAVRLPTLSLQSFWYDEAYTPVHVLHPSLVATLRSVAASENTPPLWYILEWAVSRALGTGVVALRLLSALAGIALVAVGWAIGEQAGTRRTAVILAALLAFNPLFVWYSQEARAYELYALAAALSLLFFLRSRARSSRTNLALWAASAVAALACHYFAVFLVVPEALLLIFGSPPSAARRIALPRRHGELAAAAAVGMCAAALVPLVISQAGRGTQWIGQWALADRLLAIPSYYLLGANGSVLGHGLLALSALPLLAVVALALVLARRARLGARELDALGVTLGIGLAAIAMPLALALAGADYLAPRNLIGAWVALTAAAAVVLASTAAARAGALLATLACLAGAAVIIATDLDPRLQRADWSALATSLRRGTPDRVIVTVELGAAPLEYYLPGLRLRYLSRRRVVAVREVDLVGYAPLRAGAPRDPARAFALAQRSDSHGLLAYRYLATAPVRLSGRALRRLTITVGAESSSEVLAPAAIGR